MLKFSYNIDIAMPQDTTDKTAFYEQNADRLIEESLRGDGPFTERLAEVQQGFLTQLRAKNDFKIRNNQSGVLSDEQIIEQSQKQMQDYAEKTLKPGLIAAAKGERSQSSLQQSLAEGMQMVGQFNDTKNAFSNFNILNPVSWLALPLAIMQLVTQNDFVKAAVSFFGKKDENGPQTYGEALAQVRSEKRLTELARMTGSSDQSLVADGKHLLEEMNRPLQPPANDNMLTAEQIKAAEEVKRSLQAVGASDSREISPSEAAENKTPATVSASAPSSAAVTGRTS